MSGLEEQLASAVQEAGSLNQQVRDFYDTERARVDTKLGEVDAALGDFTNALEIIVHVDQVNGSDTNDGSVGSPIKTIGRAVSHHAKPFSHLTIVLMSDYLAEQSRWSIPVGAHVRAYPLGNIERTLTLKVHDSPVTAGLHEVSGFMVSSRATPSTIEFRSLHIKFPPQDSRAMGEVRDNCLLKSFGSAGAMIAGITFSQCTLEMPPNGEGYVISADGRAAVLIVKLTATIGSFAGRWAEGAPAGTLVADTPNILSNMTSL